MELFAGLYFVFLFEFLFFFFSFFCLCTLCRIYCDPTNEQSCTDSVIHYNATPWSNNLSMRSECTLKYMLTSNADNWQCCNSTRCVNTSYFTTLDYNYSKNNRRNQGRGSFSTDNYSFNARAEFSSNYLEIYVYVYVLSYFGNMKTRIGDESGNNYNYNYNYNYSCRRIFDTKTFGMLSNYSECDWDFDKQLITIRLSSMSTIQVTDSLIIRPHVFVIDSHSGQQTTSNVNRIIIDIVRPNKLDTIVPVVSLYNFKNVIGLCDQLILDARNSYNLGMFYFHCFFILF